MPAIVRTRHPHDFLALVPQLIGFEPRESVVLVAFRGHRTCGAMRVDLPRVGKPQLHARISTTLIGMFCRIRDADAVLPVIYTGARFSGRGIPHAAFAAALVARARHAGYAVRDALCVAADGWGSYLDDDCPASGHRLGDIRQSRVVDDLPPELTTDLPSPGERARLPTVDPAARRRVADHLAVYRRVLGDPTTNRGLLAFNRRCDTVRLAESALELDIDTLRPAAAAALLHAVQAPPHRDQLMLQFAFGAGVGLATRTMNLVVLSRQLVERLPMDEIVFGAAADSSECELESIITGRSRVRPDVARVLEAIALLKKLVALAPEEARPAPLCMLGWLSWALGRGSVAHIFIREALQIDPDYGMARLEATLLAAGHLPEWAFRTGSSTD